MVASRHFKNR